MKFKVLIGYIDLYNYDISQKKFIKYKDKDKSMDNFVESKLIKIMNFLISHPNIYCENKIDPKKLQETLQKKYEFKILVEYDSLEYATGMVERADDILDKTTYITIIINNKYNDCIQKYALVKELLHILDSEDSFLNNQKEETDFLQKILKNGVKSYPLLNFHSINLYMLWLENSISDDTFQENMLGNLKNLETIHSNVKNYSQKNFTKNKLEKRLLSDKYYQENCITIKTDNLLSNKDFLITHKEWAINEEVIKFVTSFFIAPPNIFDNEKSIEDENIIKLLFEEKIFSMPAYISINNSNFFKTIIHNSGINIV